MTATIISFASRSSVAGPPIDRKRSAETRRHLAAIKNHRGSMAARQAVHARGRAEHGDTPDDPIYKAIDDHCAAIVAYHMTLDVEGDDEGALGRAVAKGRAVANECEALRELISCRPISLDGILAWLNHLGQPVYLIHGRKGTGKTILQEAMEISKGQGQAFPLTLEDTLRAVIIAICSRPPRRRRRK
jgi:hypothetical protein